MYGSNPKRIILILIFLSLVFIDQLSKYTIRRSGGFYICNENIAFGINVPDIIFWIFWVGIIMTLSFILYKKYLEHNTLYIILILSGAISNMIDRFSLGCVIDFINLKIWPVFNFADILITAGGLLIIFNFLKKDRDCNY